MELPRRMKHLILLNLQSGANYIGYWPYALVECLAPCSGWSVTKEEIGRFVDLFD